MCSFLTMAIAKATNGAYQCRARILMDPGAETSLISEKLASDLKLQRYSNRLHIEGITGGEVSKYYIHNMFNLTFVLFIQILKGVM